MTMASLPLGISLLQALRAHGAQEIFGIPGDFILPFFRQIETSQILPLYTFSHEPGLGFAADSAARMHGGLGVVAVTYGAGALNVANAVAGAFAERSPLVVLAGCPGEVEARSGLVLHHQARHLDSQSRIFREITCDQVRLNDPATAPALIARALRHCREYAQPVLIEIPRDQATTLVDAVQPLPARKADPAAVAECASEILDRLALARQPVMLVDVEIRRFGLEHKVAELVRRLDLPILTTFMGRGLLAEHGLAVPGTYLGMAGDAATSRLLEESDLPLMFGVIMSDNNFGVSAQGLDFRKAIVAAGREVRISHHLYQEIALAELVDALLDRLPPSADGNRRSHPVPAMPARTGLPVSDVPLQAAHISPAINDILQTHGTMPVASDIGDCLFAAMELLPTPLIAPAYYASMGFGVPAGMGAQIASGQRSLILVGDGAFQMTGWELGNCHRYGLDPVVLVLNNQMWEMIRVFQPESRSAHLGDWQYARLADALGGKGYRATTPAELQHALQAAFAERGRFQLVECLLAPGDSTPLLQRFSASIQAARARAAG